MYKKKAYIASGIIIFILLFGVVSGYIRIHIPHSVPNESSDFVKKLGCGYNIGNSLDACDWSTMFENNYGNDTEIFWGTPEITQAFVNTLHEQGFKTVRVPVTYMNHIDKDGNIDTEWLNRVAEVVDMVIAKDMYCIIDIHHDTGNDGWIKASEKNYKENEQCVKNLISQIASRFQEYDDWLILESFNEMVDEKCHWQNAPISSLRVFNKWNQLFVDTVRATGGRNSDRYLLINTYASTVNTKNIYYFELPEDSVKNKLIVGVHNYASPKNLDKSFQIISSLKKRGYPVIIGEFGNTANANFDRAEFVRSYIELCKNNNYCAIWWDNGQNPIKNPDSSFALFDRDVGTTYYSEIVNYLTLK